MVIIWNLSFRHVSVSYVACFLHIYVKPETLDGATGLEWDPGLFLACFFSRIRSWTRSSANPEQGWMDGWVMGGFCHDPFQPVSQPTTNTKHCPTNVCVSNISLLWPPVVRTSCSGCMPWFSSSYYLHYIHKLYSEGKQAAAVPTCFVYVCGHSQ